jgi:hypothetical protein
VIKSKLILYKINLLFITVHRVKIIIRLLQ